MTRNSKTIAKSMVIATKKSKPLDFKMQHDGSDVEVRKVAVADVAVEGRWRSLNKKNLAELTVSMREIGLQTPITVRIMKNGFRLVTGHHRLEVAKRLRWKQIDALVTSATKIDCQLWHDAENLHRADLTALEHAEAVSRWAKRVAEKAAQRAHPGGHQPHDKGVSKAAKAIGTTRDNVRRSRAIADISSTAKKAARNAGLADNEAALLKIAKEAPQHQVDKVRELANGKRAPKPKLSTEEKKQFKRLKGAFRRAHKFKNAWAAAAPIVRQKFLKVLRGPPADRNQQVRR